MKERIEILETDNARLRWQLSGELRNVQNQATALARLRKENERLRVELLEALHRSVSLVLDDATPKYNEKANALEVAIEHLNTLREENERLALLLQDETTTEEER